VPSFPNSRTGTFLNARAVAFVGVLSYSLYLWQQPFLRAGHAMRFPFSIVLIGAVAVASYYLVERPVLRLRQRLEATRKAVTCFTHAPPFPVYGRIPSI